MKQLLQNLRSGETYVAEVPVPAPQAGEVLVRNAVSLVSAGTERTLVEFAEKSLLGKARSRPDLLRQVVDKARREGLLTTLSAAFNRLDQPMPLGYSSAGVIEALGEGVHGLQVGQRVACAGGNYAVHAEYVAVPRNLVTPLPEKVDFEAAAFTTLGAIALHGFRLAEAQLGERVAVIGLGLLGLLAVQLARAAGCRVLGIDLDSRRVELAQRLGVEAIARAGALEAAQSFSAGRGCDAVLICADSASADPVELAGVLARDRARVVATGAVGLHLPRKIYYEKELAFINSRSYGPGRYDPAYEEGGQDYPIGYVRWTEGRNLEAFVELLAAGQVDVRPLVTHRFPISRAAEAYALITGKTKAPFLGVLLAYPGENGEGRITNGELGIKGEELGIRKDELGFRKEQTEDVVPQSQILIPNSPFAKSSAPAIPDARPLTPVSQVNLGVLGAGSFATAVLLPAIRKIPGIIPVGIISASGASAQHAASRFDFQWAASDEARVLEDPQINTVAILTRHHLHARQVVAALHAGKHVFCEKPLALKEEELEEIIEALGEKGGEERGEGEGTAPLTLAPSPLSTARLLFVGFNRRFAPLAQRLGAFLAGRQEPLAAHYRVNAGYLPLTHWTQDPSQGGGRIIGEACHFIDFLTFLTGAPPVAVVARGLPEIGRYREDNVVLTFTFPDGSLGTVSYLANGDKAYPKERVEVFCGGRAAALDDFRALETVQDGRRQVFRARLRQDKGHQGEWLALEAALRAGGPPPIPYAHLFGVTRASFAAVQALRSGKEIGV